MAATKLSATTSCPASGVGSLIAGEVEGVQDVFEDIHRDSAHPTLPARELRGRHAEDVAEVAEGESSRRPVVVEGVCHSANCHTSTTVLTVASTDPIGDDAPMSIIAQLKQARIDAGLSQKQLAERMGLSNVAISRFESGHRGIDLRYVEAWASHCGLALTLGQAPAVDAHGLSEHQLELVRALVAILPMLGPADTRTLWLLVEGWRESVSSVGKESVKPNMRAG